MSLHKWLLPVSTGLLMLLAQQAHAENIYCSFKGAKQGLINGDRGLGGDATLIPIQALGQDVAVPRDDASGLPTGRRQYQPLQLQKSLDRASPQLFQALVTNERLSSVTCTFYRARPFMADGTPKPYFVIKLTNANLTGLQLSGHGAAGGAANAGEHETISLTFQKIELTDLDSGVTSQDDWESRV